MDVLRSLTTLFSANRLYSLEGPGAIASLQVERWIGREGLSENFLWDVYALASDPGLDLETMLGQCVALHTTLTDGSVSTRSGLVAEAECIGFDAGLARYRLQLAPWLAALDHGRDQRTFVNQSVADILDRIFGGYADIAGWRYTADANQRIQSLGPRDYVVQYRTHSNLDFVRYVLAEAGLGFCFVEDGNAPAGHTMIVFDDSAQLPEDDTSTRRGGVPQRMSGATVEPDDAILGMGQSMRLMADRVTLLSSDYRGNQSITGSASLGNTDGARELYDDVGPEAFDGFRQADDAARRHADAIFSRARFWVGYSTVRTARSGRNVRVADGAWRQQLRGDGTSPDTFLLTDVAHAGVNNLPETVIDVLERRLGPLRLPDVDARLLRQAELGGYANRFEAVPREQVWRPTLDDGTGQRWNPVPTAIGAQTAIVVGAQGETEPGASGPVHTDGQGRIRLRFHWQAEGDKGTYPTRAMQRLAGDGHGLQQTQRIGQEVLVQFHHGLIHRPIVLGGLFNGQGEGGDTPTPGGAAAQPGDKSVYAQATDRAASGQGNVAGGNSPMWHGAGGGSDHHAHAGALSGFKSQGFDGQGANQLATDDSDGMGRVQMGTTHAATQLNLGHLRYQSDNYLGSFRGQGFELRTDAYGALRAARGALLTSYAVKPGQPAGEASALQALFSQQAVLAESLDQAAGQHGTLPLAAQRGTRQSAQSRLDAGAAPLKLLERSLKTTVGQGGFSQALADAKDRAAGKPLSHTGDAVLGIAAQGGQGMLAGQGLQWAAGETLTLGSGADTNVAVNQVLRMHSGQGIGWLAGARAANGTGLNVISGRDNLDLQAQHDALGMRAKDALKVASANANVELTGKTTVNLAVSGGAHITIEGGNVTFGCPGKLVIHAAQHQYSGATDFPREQGKWGDLGQYNEYYHLHDAATGEQLKNLPYRMVGEGGEKLEGVSRAGDGRTATFSTHTSSKPVRVEYTGNEEIDHGW
ncbi:MAG: type VI secretion system tip protein VgrG [Burkholderia sp.]|jgi:type VI secretion system VgrG family protein|uniref:type VI secretion system Vgr family protein n=1 Tax=Burkholderia sp. TaxID=36773 RepID=UPI00283A452D|nr:type VI secretion system Vgr family protein [Burkholderia sp.]MDR0244000.1 type VI secretion system tip protein VgrG [Burkholderia sp.]